MIPSTPEPQEGRRLGTRLTPEPPRRPNANPAAAAGIETSARRPRGDHGGNNDAGPSTRRATPAAGNAAPRGRRSARLRINRAGGAIPVLGWSTRLQSNDAGPSTRPATPAARNAVPDRTPNVRRRQRGRTTAARGVCVL